MRVLMVSKALVIGAYQRKAEEIARRGVELMVLVPPSWRDRRGCQELERVHTAGCRRSIFAAFVKSLFWRTASAAAA